MLNVSTRKLVEAVVDAEAFELPEMSDGADYLYGNVYQRLSSGDEFRLSKLDFDAFDLDDIDTIRDVHTDVIEPNEYKAGGIARSLRGLASALGFSSFV